MMRTYKVSGIPIIDKNGRLVASFSATDLLVFLFLFHSYLGINRDQFPSDGVYREGLFDESVWIPKASCVREIVGNSRTCVLKNSCAQNP